jgi:hypothetical protein
MRVVPRILRKPIRMAIPTKIGIAVRRDIIGSITSCVMQDILPVVERSPVVAKPLHFPTGVCGTAVIVGSGSVVTTTGAGAGANLSVDVTTGAIVGMIGAGAGAG